MNIQNITEIGHYRFNTDKNKFLKETRGINFDDVVKNTEMDRSVLGVVNNPSSRYSGQGIIEVLIDGYPCSVPFVVESNGKVFLKTVYRDRKLLVKYNIKYEK